jgi:hypothetical protein
MKPKPPCPQCGVAILVKTYCGSSKGVYAYVCYAHDPPVKWNQIPPHMLRNSTDSSRVRMKNTNGGGGGARSYRCGKCGVAPKKGHVCPDVCLGSRPPNLAASSAASLPQAPPPQTNDYEDDMDDDDEDALPPAPPALLQLRPLSEVSKRIAEA